MSADQPHDKLFRLIFSRPDMAADLMRRALPPGLVAALDLDRVEKVSVHSLDASMRARRADLIFRVPLRSAPGVAFVCVLIEHQSTPDPLMAYRLMTYAVGAWSDCIEAHRAEHGRPPRRLPAVVPLVLYQGRHRWRAARRLSEVIDLPPDLRAQLGDHLPELHLLVDDLSLTDDAAIEGSTRHALTAATLMAMRYVRREDDADAFLARWVRRIQLALREPEDRMAVEAVARYLYDHADHIGGEQLIEAVESAADPGDKEAMMSLTDKLIEMGHKKGLAKGLAEGIGQGMTRVLLTLIQLKFGEPDAAMIERVRRADADTIERWSGRVLTAASLADVFADEPR